MSGIIQFEKFCERNTSSLKYALAVEVLKEFKATVEPRKYPRQPVEPNPITPAIRNEIIRLHWSKEAPCQHDIAMQLNVNQGRINEVLKGISG